MKIIELKKSVTASNDADAAALREELACRGILMVNIMSAAGSGKTTLLGRIIEDLRGKVRIGVIEADIDASVDAERIEQLGGRSIQAHTDGMCHMDAGMTAAALKEMGPDGLDMIFLENVGNLICPAEYATGSHINVMLLSVPEGDDKPLKYPLMFQSSDALVITKTDALPYFSFDTEKCSQRARMLNDKIQIFPVSAKTGNGMEKLEEYLLREMKRLKQV